MVATQTLMLLDAQIGTGSPVRGGGSQEPVSKHFVPTKVALAQLHEQAGERDAAVRFLREAGAVDESVHSQFLKPLLEGKPPGRGV